MTSRYILIREVFTWEPGDRSVTIAAGSYEAMSALMKSLGYEGPHMDESGKDRGLMVDDFWIRSDELTHYWLTPEVPPRPYVTAAERQRRYLAGEFWANSYEKARRECHNGCDIYGGALPERESY